MGHGQRLPKALPGAEPESKVGEHPGSTNKGILDRLAARRGRFRTTMSLLQTALAGGCCRRTEIVWASGCSIRWPNANLGRRAGSWPLTNASCEGSSKTRKPAVLATAAASKVAAITERLAALTPCHCFGSFKGDPKDARWCAADMALEQQRKEKAMSLGEDNRPCLPTDLAEQQQSSEQARRPWQDQ